MNMKEWLKELLSSMNRMDDEGTNNILNKGIFITIDDIPDEPDDGLSILPIHTK